MTTLMDTVRIDAPKRSPVRPASPLDPSWDDDPILYDRPDGSAAPMDRLAMA